MGPDDFRISPRLGQIPLYARGENLLGRPFLHAHQDFGNGKEPHGHADEVNPVPEGGNPEGKPDLGGQRIHSHYADRQAEQAHEQRLQQRAAGEVGNGGQAEDHEGEIFRRPEFQGQGNQQGRQEHQTEDTEDSGDERTDGGNPQSGAGLAFPGHLVAVEAGHHRGRLTGNVDQDGSGRSAVHGPVIDGGNDDNRGRRVHAVGHGQKKGYAHHRADAREDPDRGPSQTAEESRKQIHRRQGDGKTQVKVRKDIHPKNTLIREESASQGKNALRKRHLEESRKKPVRAKDRCQGKSDRKPPRAPPVKLEEK